MFSLLKNSQVTARYGDNETRMRLPIGRAHLAAYSVAAQMPGAVVSVKDFDGVITVYGTSLS